MSTREEEIGSIRQLADWLEAHPEIPIPYEVSKYGYVLVMTHDTDDPKAVVAAVARALPGKVSKNTYGEGSQAQFQVSGKLGTITVNAIANRDEVCERIVTGTREVTEEVPDPDKLAEVPTVTMTKTVEDVEWRCAPVLAGDE